MRVRPYFIEKDKIDGAVLSFIDIADLKKHEEELRREEEKYRTLAENSPDVIARFDKNLRYSYTNSVIEEVTGLPPEGIHRQNKQGYRFTRKNFRTINHKL